MVVTSANVEIAVGTALNIAVAQGGTYTLMVEAVDGSNAPFALDGFRAHMQIRKRAGTAGDPIVDLSSIGISPDIFLEPEDDNGAPQVGIVEVRIPATKTTALTRTAVYDLFLIDENDSTERIRLLNGTVTVARSVTTEA